MMIRRCEVEILLSPSLELRATLLLEQLLGHLLLDHATLTRAAVVAGHLLVGVETRLLQ